MKRFALSLVSLVWASGCLVSAAPANNREILLSGAFLDVNGQTEIPRAMFGVHATPLTPAQREEWGVEMVRVIRHNPDANPLQPGHRDVPEGVSSIIECWYDRYQPALSLTDPDGWADRLATLARDWAMAAQEVETPVILEFWNEPYLNWASRPGVNYDGRFFSSEGRAEGAEVRGRDGEVIPGLVWERVLRAIDGRGLPDYLASRYMPGTIGGRPPREGDVFNFRGRPKELRTFWWVRDTEQPDFWSGPFNRERYHEMLAVLLPAIRETAPDVPLIAGWDFHFQQAGWKAWDLLHRPMLDAFGDQLDGITEHHYGIDTRFVAAAYEVIDAYMENRFQRRIGFYNTEAGGFLDPEQPSPHARPQYHASTPEEFWGTMIYSFRDILHLLAFSPDKAASRAAHAAHQSGDRYALPFMRELRGQLLEVESGDPEIWVVAAYDEERQQIAVYAFSDHARASREVTVHLSLPAGLSASSVRRAAPVRDATAGIHWPEETLVWPEGDVFRETVTMAPRNAMRWVIPVEGSIAGQPQRFVQHTQVYAPDILLTIASGDRFIWNVPVPEALTAQPAEARRAPLFRWVYWGYDPAHIEWQVNGQPWDAPRYRPGVLTLGPLSASVWDDPLAISLTAADAEEARFSLQVLSVVWRWEETRTFP